jgi:transcription termination/antitermination protein NusG
VRRVFKDDSDQQLWDRIFDRKQKAPKFRITCQKGSAVRINSGPFMDINGVVDEILPKKKKLRVLVPIFGRETPLEFDFALVERI